MEKQNKSGQNKIVEKIRRLLDYTDVILTLLMSGSFLMLWLHPEAGDINNIFYFSILMAFEFFMVHSGVLMAMAPLKTSLSLFVPVYGIFALVFFLVSGLSSILWLYLLVVLNRMRFAFFNVDENTKQQVILTSIFAAIIYFFLLIPLAVGAELIPDFGLSETFLEESGYNAIKRGSGIFIDSPKVSMCFGALYYFFLSLYDFFAIRKRQILPKNDCKSDSAK